MVSQFDIINCKGRAKAILLPMHKGQKRILLIFSLTLFFTSYARTAKIAEEEQVPEARLKAALILNFAKNLRWASDAQIKIFRIALFDDDTILFHELRKAEKHELIRGKEFTVSYYSHNDTVPNCEIVYFSERYSRNLARLLSKNSLSRGMLVITDRAPDRLLSMINLFYNSERNTITFEINRANLQSGGFLVNPELLLLGGSYIDLKELYIDTYSKLKKETERLGRYQKELSEINRERQSYLKQIKALLGQTNALKEQINRGKNRYNELLTNLKGKDSLLQERTRELEQKQNESRKLQKTIHYQLSAIAQARMRLDSLNRQIEKKEVLLSQKQTRIDNQNIELSRKESIILKQQKKWYISLVLLLGLSLSLFFAYWAYMIKKRLNRKLEKQVEKRTAELQISQQHYQNLFEVSPVALLEMDLSGLKKMVEAHFTSENAIGFSNQTDEIAFFEEAISRISLLNMNKTAIKLFGFTTKEEAFGNFRKTFHPKSISYFNRIYHGLYTDQRFVEYESIRLTAQQDVIYTVTKWLVVPGYENSYQRVLVSITNITEIKQFQNELKRHKEHLEELVKERTGEVLSLNRELLEANEELSQTIQKLKDTQEQLIQSEKMASLGMLTAGIAHEINNPINYISGSQQALNLLFNELLNQFMEYRTALARHTKPEKFTELTPKSKIEQTASSIRELLNNIETGIFRTTSIIKSLQVFARNEHDQLAPCNLKEIIEDVIKLQKGNLPEKVAIKLDYAENIGEFLCSRNGLYQIMMNLIANAIDAIPESGTIHIRCKLNRKSSKVIVTVSDNGVGIKKENIDKIFDPFFTTKEVGKGTGLGLYITYNIIKTLNGCITVRSEPDSETTFTVQLPFRGVEVEEIAD